MRPIRATPLLIISSAVAALCGVAALVFYGAFDAAGFPPRWYCGTWSATLGWTHVVADILIWLAYTAIPVVIILILRRRSDAAFPRVGWLFAAFILACGAVHLVEAVIFWWPIYRFSAVVKSVTAVVSWATVFALFPVLPRALNLPSRLADIKSLIQHAPTAMLVADQSGRIVMVNASAARMFAYEAEELIGQPIEVLVPSRIRDQHPSLRDSYFRAPTITQLGEGRELTGVRKDGQEIAVEVGLTPLRMNNRHAALACIVDQTLRKKRRESELSELSQALALREVVGGLAHELNTPAQQIVAWTAVARLHDSPENLVESLGGLTSAAEDVGRIVHKLRDVIIRREPADEPIDLNQLVKDTIALMHREIGGTGTSLDDGRPTVYADPIQLQLVLANLIRNAHQSGGPVTITTHLAGDKVTLHVDDRGAGFTVDPERLFEPFFSTKSDGLGMGLTVSQAIVRRYGGRIKATRLDRGARFEVTLPAHRENESA